MKKLTIAILIFVLITGIASAKEFTFETGEYRIEDIGGFEILTTENTITHLWDNDFVLVKKVFQAEFPRTQVINELNLVEFKNPVEFTLNFPTAQETELYEFDYIDRVCYENTIAPEFFVNDPMYSEDVSIYPIEIYPVEVLDCEAGKIRLFQTVVYEAIMVESYAFIEKINVPEGSTPGSSVPVGVLMNQEVDGELVITDIIGEVLVSSKINGKTGAVVMDVPNFSDEFTVEYREDGKTISYKNFNLKSSWGSVDFRAYVGDNDNVIPLKINITNFHEKEISVKGTLELIDIDGITTNTIDLNYSLKSGINIFDFDVPATDVEKDNDIRIILFYEGEEESVLHNTIMRIDPEQIEWAKQELEKRKQNETVNEINKSNLVGIAIAVILFILLGYIALRYLIKREES